MKTSKMAALYACPVTVALRRRFGSHISVSRDYIRALKKRTKLRQNKWVMVPLPATARNFLLNYYKYNTPQPFSFKLTPKVVKILKG